MTATILEEKLDRPLLFPGLSWEQFKTLEPMLDIPKVRLSFLDGILERGLSWVCGEIVF
ncbi:hypothetical protein [Microcoleus sp. CAWBG58]|uniref:hypothetical protein n=1 Tax=Microcoleus sp. CAWBG58 TaxID=2841651 RepID=UPI0025F309E0|nr:hypothetical protein [Microcoleus sp. CAWBG58]